VRTLAAFGILAFLLGLAMPPAAMAVFTADEICAPTDDPCVISTTINVDSGADLDFGFREVQIVNSGQLDIGAGTARLRCGSFSASGGSSPGIKARGSNGLGNVVGGSVDLQALRGCLLDSDIPCVSDLGCQFGECSVGVCQGNFARSCSDDGECDLGTCSAENTCSGAANFACAVDADCQLGNCSVTVCSFDRTKQCSSDSDCDAGACEIGDGDVVLDRKIRADGYAGGEILISAAGDITINKSINAEATNVDEDGGIIDLESGKGTIWINDEVKAVGGGLSTGGEICITASEDIVTTAAIDATGGDFDGGYIEIDAGNDVLLSGDLAVSSINGEGYGGEILVYAGRDLIFSGTGRYHSNGHMSSETFGGDGGDQGYTALRNIAVGPDALFECEGARPDGSGGAIELLADGTMTFQGEIRARSRGDEGSGGAIDLTSEGVMLVDEMSRIDASGGEFGGGNIDFYGGSDMTLAGTLDSLGASGGAAGTIYADSDGTLDVDGSITVNGTPDGAINGSVDLTACRININNGSLIDNRGGLGTNSLTGRERVSILPNGQLQNEVSGTNTIYYRDPNKAPVIDGVVSPAPLLILDEELAGCPVCGNAELDQFETCDDGNTMGGDGCSADCQDENCIAQTPGYPDVDHLCDDGNGCTGDSCVDGTCVSEITCDDGIDCTVDTCGEGNICVRTPIHAACDDGNQCTTDSCSTVQGCMHASSNGLCDDGIDCTTNDVCFNGGCLGVPNCGPDMFCNDNTGECVGTTTTTTTSTTTTTLSQVCGNSFVEDPEQCDDGDTVWVPGLYCDAECNELACGDTDNSGDVRATDALFILRVAVGLEECTLCVCDVDASGATTAGDALRSLRESVGIPADLTCPICPN